MKGLWLLVLAWGFVWLAPTATASQPVGPSLQPVVQVSFCETGPGHDTRDCPWQTVSLPHRWKPTGPDSGWGVYRIGLPGGALPASRADPGHPAVDRLALLAQRAALSASLRTHPQGPEVEPHPQGTYLRYWPLVFPLPATDPGAPGAPDAPRTPGTPEAREVFLLVTGHAAMKNGLGSLHWGPEEAIRQEQARIWFGQVTAILALASATIVVGLLGLIPGHTRSVAGILMLCIAGLALTAGVRILLNFVTTPPLGWHSWSALNLGLLLATGLWEIAILAVYLLQSSRRILPALGLLWLALAIALLAVPSPSIYAVAEAGFLFNTLSGAVLVLAVAYRVWKAPEFVGLTLVAVCATVVLLGAHDLLLHLGSRSVSNQYLLVWSIPGLLMLLTALMMRHLERQHSLERALQGETARRERLVQDLHDGLGSRLVALAFHVARRPGDQALADEIQAAIRELQLIQGTARSGSTTLTLLLANLRHLYGHLGGGQLPLRWEIDEACPEIPLSAEQAVATVRIFDEAVANALKHAHPQRIDIALSPGPQPWAARLSIRNDGKGHFARDSHGGLRNMQLRAQQTGLTVQLAEHEGIKEVMVGYRSNPAARDGWWRGIAALWQRAQTPGVAAPINPRHPPS